MYKLDKKDQKVLSILDIDARITLSRLAKKVELSRDVVNYRLNRLETKGIIQGYYTVINLGKIGYYYCRSFFKFRKITPEIEKDILEYCKSNPRITWLIRCEGKYDISVMFVDRSLKEIEETYDAFLTNFGKFISVNYLSLAHRIYHYANNYLHQANEKSYSVMEGNPKSMVLDPKDLKLLSALSNNGRMTLVDLAKELGMTSKALAYRIKRLMKKNIILGFRAKINSKYFGYDHYKIFLQIDDLSQKNRLITYLSANPNVVYITKSMGLYNLEFEIKVRSMNELHEHLKKMKTELGEIISSYETTLYYEEPFVSYFPGR